MSACAGGRLMSSAVAVTAPVRKPRTPGRQPLPSGCRQGSVDAARPPERPSLHDHCRFEPPKGSAAPRRLRRRSPSAPDERSGVAFAGAGPALLLCRAGSTPHLLAGEPS